MSKVEGRLFCNEKNNNKKTFSLWGDKGWLAVLGSILGFLLIHEGV